jgi:hypothetical protein
MLSSERSAYWSVMLAFFLFSLISPAFLHASDEPFTYPANWGGTGLMEIPTARIMKKHAIRGGISQAPFDGLRLTGE